MSEIRTDEIFQEDTRKSSTDPQHVRKFDVAHETGCSSIERELKKTIFPEILKARQDRLEIHVCIKYIT